MPSERELVKNKPSGENPNPHDLPFGLKADQLIEPFCACGHVVSMCDGSRRGCRQNPFRVTQ